MDAIVQALADPAVRGGYLMACFAVLILPIVALSVWFHRRIGKNAGGRQLMERQRGARTWARGSLADAAYNAGDGLSIMRDVHAGRYGQQTKTLMGRVYWFVATWIALNAVAFGVLIWADEANRVIE